MLRRGLPFVVLVLAGAGACADNLTQAVNGGTGAPDGSAPTDASAPDTSTGHSDSDAAVSPFGDSGVIDAAPAKCDLPGPCPTGTCRSGAQCDLVAFVTDETYVADGFPMNAAGIARLDSACQQSAANAQLAGTFIAWAHENDGQGPSTFPYARLGSNHALYALLDGTLVTPDIEILATGGIPVTAIGVSATKTKWPGVVVWTGLNPDGTAPKTSGDCSRWTDTTAMGEVGTVSTSEWLGGVFMGCGFFNHLYCFQKP
jgi:hypothetical protein